MATAGERYERAPSIEAWGCAHLEMMPDRGRLVVGVSNQAPSAAKMARLNAAAMEQLMAAVKAKLTSSSDQLRMVGYWLYPKTEGARLPGATTRLASWP